MNRIHKLFTIIALITMFTNSAYTQEPIIVGGEYGDDATEAYVDGSDITRMAAYVPVAALILAAIFLARVDQKTRHHHHKHHHSHSDYSDYYSYAGYWSYYSSYGYGSSSYSSGYSSH